MSSQNLNGHSEPMDIRTNGSSMENGSTDEIDEGITMKLSLGSMSSLDNSVPPSPTKSSALKRNTSTGKLMPVETKETRVKVIYTGGTIGMVRNERNGKCFTTIVNCFG